jgi:nucleoside-diphosphate-sugar epimerase
VGKDPDRRNYIVSNDKINKTGFECEYTLDDGIQELIKGYKILYDSAYTNL